MVSESHTGVVSKRSGRTSEWLGGREDWWSNMSLERPDKVGLRRGESNMEGSK